ncbi:MAG: VTT domain-containing protein [Micropepsaceae bacterium]
MIQDVGMLFLSLGSNPWAIAIVIVAATFVLEDVATVAAALLAADNMIAPSLALTALFVGIFIGDLGLYGLGAAARSREWARRMIGERRMTKGRAWLKRRYVTALLGARFTPGFRLPTYSASGFLGLPFLTFAAVSAGASLVWTGLIFSLVFYFGPMIVENLGIWRWALAAALLALILAGPTIAERIVARSSANGAENG